MGVKSKRTCDCCHKEMELGEDATSHKDRYSLTDEQLIDKDSGLVVKEIHVHVKVDETLDICDKCALGLLLTTVKEQLARFR
jgi:hypothetical protein